MFSTAESTPHSIRKRFMSNIYSKSSVHSSPSFIAASEQIVCETLLSRLDATNQQPCNARRIFESATMDIVTAYLYGLSGGSNFLGDRDDADKWIGLYQARRAHTFWPQELPGLQALLSRIGIHVAPKWIAAANEHLETWNLRLCDAAEQQLKAARGAIGRADHDTPAVYAQLHAQMHKTPDRDAIYLKDPAIPKRIYMASEMHDHLSAGHETSAITLTFLFHELSLRPSLQARLREELLCLDPRILQNSDEGSGEGLKRSFPSPRAIDALPLLHATLMETLRLHAAIPGPQPRVTPHRNGGSTLGAFAGIPGGVRVSSSAWSLHRNGDVFPSPDMWIPERWLKGWRGADASPRTDVGNDARGDEQENARLAEMHRWHWAFSSGGRMCIGSHLAMAQMKAVCAAVLARFRVERPSDMLEQGEEEPFTLRRPFVQEDAYTAQPVDEELLLRFVRVS